MEMVVFKVGEGRRHFDSRLNIWELIYTWGEQKPNRFTELPKKPQKTEPQLPKPIEKPHYRNRIYRNRKVAVRGIGKLEEGNQNISIIPFALALNPQPRTQQQRTPDLCLSLTLSGDNSTAAAPTSPPLTSPPPTSAQVLLDSRKKQPCSDSSTSAQVLLDARRIILAPPPRLQTAEALICAQDLIRRSPVDLDLGCAVKNRDIDEFNEKMRSLNIGKDLQVESDGYLCVETQMDD
ncbi:hypothetical protein LXL04_039021 [Taraxacum kok-saghyz]